MSHDFYMVIHINTKILIATNFIALSAGETVNNNFEITVLALDIYTKYHNKPCKYELIRVKKNESAPDFSTQSYLLPWAKRYLLRALNTNEPMLSYGEFVPPLCLACTVLP